jgi:poly-gamma-glutamate synthase PgsB/CapB
MSAIDFSTWIPGWFSLAAVTLYGALLVGLAIRAKAARDKYKLRILVTGTRGKSGTVRLIHAGLLNSGFPTYGKVTGTTAVELFPTGEERETRRFGTPGISEMPQAVRRGIKSGASHGVFECMAISPSLIHTIQAKYVHGHIVVIPTIRLDHLEDEGLTEFEIGMNILNAISRCDYLVTGVEQPELIKAYANWASSAGTKFIHCRPDSGTPPVPGHHPVNVSIAKAVLKILEVDEETSNESLKKAGLEPRALDVFRRNLAGKEVLMIDIGGANDPASAYEALANLRLDGEKIVPVLVNRWERPLRSVLFSSAVIGRFPVALVTGPLYRWLRRPQTQKFLQNSGSVDHKTKLIDVNYQDCFRPERIMKKLDNPEPLLEGPRLVFVFMENIHGTKVDLLRAQFEKGEKLRFEEVFTQ